MSVLFVKKEVEKMDRKITALTLLLITAFAALVGGFVLAAHASDTNSTDTSAPTTATLNINATDLPFYGMGGMILGDQGFGREPAGHGHAGMGGMGGMGNIEVSSEYTAAVNSILNNDTDIQNLTAQGYNVTLINPIIKSVIDADGTITTQATTAIVTLQNGTSGYAAASVDISQAKVTQIVILTRTVIDKTTS